MQLSLSEWIKIIAALAGLISFSINLIQWRTTATLKKQYYSKNFAEYNHMFRIAELADRAKDIYKDKTIPEADRLVELIRHFEQTTGIADSVRVEIQAYCEKILNKPVYRQHPAVPDPKILNQKSFFLRYMIIFLNNFTHCFLGY
jgi:hypothetical protein